MSGLVRAVLVPVEGPASVVELDDPWAGLAGVRALLGGWAELVRVPDPALALWCDEDGAVRGLTLNGHASSLACRRIVGPVVVTPYEGSALTARAAELLRDALTGP